MTSMTTATVRVIGGVDTHGQSHHAAVIDGVGRQLDDREFPASPAGYGALLEWLRGYGELDRVGVEGTGTYGVALTRHLREAQGRSSLRSTDRIDGPGGRKASPIPSMHIPLLEPRYPALPPVVPKLRDGRVEAIRALRVARSSAVKARSQATNQIKALIVTGPAQLREQLRHMPTGMIIAACARLRPGHNLGDAEQATKTALRRLARRHQQLSEEIAEADHELDQLVHQVAPALLALPGVGPEVAGQVLTSAGDNPNRIKSEAAFAHLCGAAPIPASSGRTRRHRLNRGGDRGANNALYVVVLGRLRYDSRTRAYVDRRTQEGLSKPEIIRCLKRYVARELYNALPTSIAQNRSQQPLARP